MAEMEQAKEMEMRWRRRDEKEAIHPAYCGIFPNFHY